MRNVIERLFGVWKRRFRILAGCMEYNYQTQADIVVVLAALHNFILRHGDDHLFDEVEEVLEDSGLNSINASSQLDNREMASYRDDIAQKMWNDYVIKRRH